MWTACRIAIIGAGICGLNSWALSAEMPTGSLPSSGAIQSVWSFKAGADLDADGRPASPSKETWSWGIAWSGSLRITWGDKPSATEPAMGSVDLAKSENRLIELTNAERKKLDKPALKVDSALMKLAREQSAHMARLKQISHELEGRTLTLRMNEAAYKALAAGENCAEGAASPEEAIADWLMSEGHKNNLLSDRYTRLGVGIATDSNGRHYFTQVFAQPFDARREVPPSVPVVK